MTRMPASTRMMIRNISDAIAAIPYLLGFHPADSLVVIGYDGPHNTCAVRIDLPAGDPREAAGRVAAMLGGNDFRRALIVGYGPEDRVVRAAFSTGERLAAHGLVLTDAARVSEGRWWSLTCSRTDCCPADGNPYDIATSVVAAQATWSGHVALADRSELVRTVAPLTGPARLAMRKATQQAENRLKTWQEHLTPRQFRHRITQEGITLLTTLGGAALTTPSKETGRPRQPPTQERPQGEMVRRHNARADEALHEGASPHKAVQSDGIAAIGPEPSERADGAGKARIRPGDDEVAWLGVLLTNLRVRDEAWLRIDEDEPADDIQFWRDVLSRVEDPFADAPACLLAYAAYVGGDGGLANVALERASPGYSMGALLREVIDAGIPPSEVRIRMTPEDLAAAYADREEEDTW